MLMGEAWCSGSARCIRMVALVALYQTNDQPRRRRPTAGDLSTQQSAHFCAKCFSLNDLF